MSKQIFNQRAIKGMREFSKYIVIVVRNAMEDFHYEYHHAAVPTPDL
ncbi:MAG: hypothetical protein ACYSWP_14755 [Planctomycetota bacterium]|jgi:hypothetical protein